MYHLYTVVMDSSSLSVLQMQAWQNHWPSRKDLLGIDLHPWIAQAAVQHVTMECTGLLSPLLIAMQGWDREEEQPKQTG